MRVFRVVDSGGWGTGESEGAGLRFERIAQEEMEAVRSFSKGRDMESNACVVYGRVAPGAM